MFAVVQHPGSAAIGSSCETTSQCQGMAACQKGVCVQVECLASSDCSGGCHRCSAGVCRYCGVDLGGACRC